MKAKVRLYEIETGKPIVVLNSDDMEGMSLHVGDRVKIIKSDKERTTAVIDSTTKLVKEGEIGIFEEVREELGVEDGDEVVVKRAERPLSIDFIKKKVNGEHMHGNEIRQIIEDVVDNNLSEIELTSLVVASYINGYDMDETISLTQAMVETGNQMNFGDNGVDKHCIGGVAGNRTTMIIVPIMAAAGCIMPKTSSRAITSPAGTADTMEVLAKVEFGVEELKKIVEDIGGFIIWGGSVNLAPADDKIIKVEYPLSLDPEGQVLASVIAKKKSVGSDALVIDIPVGRGAKIEDRGRAVDLARKFITVGERFEIKTKCLITDGSSPIGRGIGPALEAIDVLNVLKGVGPTDLMNKSVDLAGVLLELVGKADEGMGRNMAKEILDSGKALQKMKQIIEAQGGNPEIKVEDIRLGGKTKKITALGEGRVKYIDNKMISRVARIAGAPKDKAAGLKLEVAVGQLVAPGDTLFTIYSDSDEKLGEAARYAQQTKPVQVGGVILEEII